MTCPAGPREPELTYTKKTTTQARRLGRQPSLDQGGILGGLQATCRSYASCHSGDTLGSLLSHTAPRTSHGSVLVKRAHPARRRAGPSPGKPSQTSTATPPAKLSLGYGERAARQDHRLRPKEASRFLHGPPDHTASLQQNSASRLRCEASTGRAWL